MQKTCLFLSILTLALCLCLPVRSQIDSRLTFHRFVTHDGLPQMQTERLWQDSRGYIYVGTLSGFVRYDGREFTPFLKGRRLNIIGFAETEGQVWAFDFRRQWLTTFSNVESRPIDPEGHRLFNNFNTPMLPSGYLLLEDEKETHRLLCRLTTGGYRRVVRSPLFDLMTPDRKLQLDTSGIYIPTAKGLYRLHRGRTQLLSTKSDIFTITDGLAFASSGIYAITRHGLTMRTPFSFTDISYGLTVRPMSNGHFVIADEHTLYEYDGHEVRTLASGFNLIKDLLVDRWDRLWVATYQGLYCFYNLSFTNHRLIDPDDIVRAIATTDDGTLFLGTLNGKILHNDKIITDNPDNYYAPSAVTIYNKVYMPGNGDIVCISPGPAPRVSRLGLPNDRYTFVAEAGGHLIVGSRKAVCAINTQTLAIDTLSTDIPHPWCAAQDRQGRLWVGSTFGLYTDGNKVDYPQQLIITTMERDTRGNIIFASKDSLFLISNGAVKPLHLDGLAGHEVRSLHVSPKGYLVVAAIDGLFVSRLDSSYATSRTHFFNHLNGFTSQEPLMATMAEQGDGTVWMAGLEEMTSFRPADLLAYDEEDTYIRPQLQWWQHWWVWLIALFLLTITIWVAARWYEKRRNRRRLIRLEQEKQQRQQMIETIRREAIKDATNDLARNILKITDKATDERITLRTASGTVIADLKDIAYFKGDGNYSLMATFHSSTTVLISLGALEKELNPTIFVRADRSTIVNIHLISALQPKQHRCRFRSPGGQETETTLLAPAFKRLRQYLEQ
ncbi:MAG: LytTR family transcriptional regulator DNA-binding domain-containing protein [Bacteroidaceae bacterium]|nr:LytTR family transcriptional regulator DNA-binding domain-containing protein [Bacteroidaceae bacterium]